jgi:hypothetical protein
MTAVTAIGNERASVTAMTAVTATVNARRDVTAMTAMTPIGKCARRRDGDDGNSQVLEMLAAGYGDFPTRYI